MNNKQEIIDWLVNNKPTIQTITQSIGEEAKIMLAAEPMFAEDIIEQYKNRVQSVIAEEISKQLGIQIDVIFEILEASEIREYLIDDSLCSNNCSN